MSDIVVKDVSFSYDSGSSAVPVLNHLSMEIPSGEFVCLLGQSGCGKSTFLRLMAGLDRPDSGEILIDGKPLSGTGGDRSVVFQDYSLFPWFTAGKNILLAMQQKFPERRKDDLIAEIRTRLTEVGLSEDVYDKYPNELSGGMRQRCAICRAFALNAPVMLMDEPFGALDAVTRARLQDMIQHLWAKDGESAKRRTVLFVTHDVEEALLLATRIFVFGSGTGNVIHTCEMKDKRITSRSDLFENPDTIGTRNTLLRILNDDIGL